jgi:methylthioribulose 1-phosphate dehydratase/enolase-phosphatase E1
MLASAGCHRIATAHPQLLYDITCLHALLQGIEGHGFYGNCVVPIIENTARECELTDRMRQAIQDYPQANAVLVRRHGAWQPAGTAAAAVAVAAMPL